ncbi:unnamed protein product, partial [Mesorhabditis spiculigera]
MQKKSRDLDARQTPWAAVYTAIGFLTFTGAQMSVYFMSTMAYLMTSYQSATVETFGYVVAAGSLGVLVASPLFGFWQQKTNSTKQPVMCGFLMAGLGNFFYAFLGYYGSYVLPMALFSRFLAGFGAGTLGVLRSYIAVSSTPTDRIKAVSLSNGGFTLGLSLGPLIQICFLPFGTIHRTVLWIPLNMYTTCAFFMTLICIICLVLLFTVFREDYVGIYSAEEKKSDPFLVIPKYDGRPVAVCFYLWFCLCMVSTTLESISVPVTIAMFGWNNSESIFYNGLFMAGNCLLSVVISLLLAKTRLGDIDRRKQILGGQLTFCLFFVFCYPWSFYGNGLKAPILVNGTEDLDIYGGCSRGYLWCDTTAAVPESIYIFFFVIGLGAAFPFVSAPMHALFSEMLGPRKQGAMQGLLCFTGSVAQFICPLVITSLFQHNGYRIIMIYHFLLCAFAAVLIAVFYRHMQIMSKELATHFGSCHCGAVKWSCLAPKILKGIKCNCSICNKKQNHHVVVASDCFKLLQGEDNLTTYQFNEKKARHRFCKTCGVQSFYIPRSNPNDIAIMPHCIDSNTVTRIEWTCFNGQQWEETMLTQAPVAFKPEEK